MAKWTLLVGFALLLGCAPTEPRSTPQPGTTLPSNAQLAQDHSLVRSWASEVTSANASTRIRAQEELASGGKDALPLLWRFLRTRDEELHRETFAILYRLGPDGIPLLIELLQDPRVNMRRAAIDLLIDLAPDTAAAQMELAQALKDRDPYVARDAARALGALGAKASPSLAALVSSLAHPDVHVRIYTAEAIASIGPAAVDATDAVTQKLRDSEPGVRWAACEALGSIGPGASAAVPMLIDALKDEYLYVRICAAGALGSMGPKASSAVPALRQASADLRLQTEIAWALERVTGEKVAPPPAVIGAPIPPMKDELPTGDPPIDWDPNTGRNIAWSVPLGGEAFGRPVVAGDTVFIGTDNDRKLDPTITGECGILLALRASDGQFLWQDAAPRGKRGLREFLLPSTTSAPLVENDRLYYVTAEAQLRCLDLANKGRRVWELDLADLGVFVHEASNSEVLPVGNLLVVSTSNGQNEGHTRVPSPRAPSLVAVEKETGKVIWRSIGAGDKILHGQWCSPVAIDVGGKVQVVHGGGDGWLRAYDPATGREIWRFDGNDKDALRRPRPGVRTRCGIIAAPVFDGERVYIAMGEDPTHGDGPSLVHAISPNGQGDVTDARKIWTCRAVGRVVGKPVVKDGLLYVGDLGGKLWCLDSATGQVVWKHDTEASIWGCLALAADRLYVGNTEGVMTILRAGRKKEILATIEMDGPLYARPPIIENTLYLATSKRLFRIEQSIKK